MHIIHNEILVAHRMYGAIRERRAFTGAGYLSRNHANRFLPDAGAINACLSGQDTTARMHKGHFQCPERPRMGGRIDLEHEFSVCHVPRHMHRALARVTQRKAAPAPAHIAWMRGNNVPRVGTGTTRDARVSAHAEGIEAQCGCGPRRPPVGVACICRRPIGELTAWTNDCPVLPAWRGVRAVGVC